MKESKVFVCVFEKCFRFLIYIASKFSCCEKKLEKLPEFESDFRYLRWSLPAAEKSKVKFGGILRLRHFENDLEFPDGTLGKSQMQRNMTKPFKL